MTGLSKKHGRLLASVPAVVLAVTLIPAVLSGYGFRAEALNNPSGVNDPGGDDRKIAADISNTTGVPAEKILQLKKQGRTWNEVLEKLKPESGNSGDREQRDDCLLADTLGNDDVKALIKAGYKQEDIMEAKLLAERVIFQLQQIADKSDSPQSAGGVQATSGGAQSSEDTSAFSDLLGKMDEKKAVELMLKLRSAFGSFENVFDEYLFTLQADMNLEDYLSDKAAYLKQKEEKSRTLATWEVITMAVIEEKLLKKIQAENESARPAGADRTENPVKPAINAGETDAPQSPVPDVEDVKPKNPADEIMNEIRQISPVQN